MSVKRKATYAILGDLHGHLQLALCALARWQRQRQHEFSAIFLVGDVGTFTEDAQLDSATRGLAKNNPCELEFLTQWSVYPPPPWIDAIFQPAPGGLGLICPIIMVHGNHEGFSHLETLYPRRAPIEPVALEALPPVDPAARIHLLPPGWSVRMPEGYVVGGIGGMEAGQRRARYHPMAYIDESAVDHLRLQAGSLDILLTHQGPAEVQGDHGSTLLDPLLDPAAARFWFHGHSTPINSPQTIGSTTVVPLGDIAFHNGEPGLRGWAMLELEGADQKLSTDAPSFLREMRQKFWSRTPYGLLVNPDLALFV
jgi:predicted phosphodiesterase